MPVLVNFLCVSHHALTDAPYHSPSCRDEKEILPNPHPSLQVRSRFLPLIQDQVGDGRVDVIAAQLRHLHLDEALGGYELRFLAQPGLAKPMILRDGLVQVLPHNSPPTVVFVQPEHTNKPLDMDSG